MDNEPVGAERRAVLRALSRLPVSADAPADRPDRRWRIVRLGGLSNRSYRVSRPDPATGGDRARRRQHGYPRDRREHDYAVRLPGRGSERLIDRRREADGERLAGRLGLSPPLLYAGADGVKIARYLTHARPLEPARLRARPARADPPLALLRRLHGSGCRLAGRLDPLPVLRATIALAAPRWRLRLHPLQRRLRRHGRWLRIPYGARRPCHGDPSPANFIRDGSDGRWYLLDWEYAGAGSPCWDLAVLAVEAELDPAATVGLLRRYRRGRPAGRCAASRRRFQAHCAALALIAAAWGAAQRNGGENAADGAYIRRRLARARRELKGW